MYKSKIKITIILIVLLSILAIFPSVVKATDTTYTSSSTINGVTVNWSYEINESNEIEELICTNIEDLTENIAIPSSIDGKNVVSLGFKAFNASATITEVTLPNTLRNVGGYAFAGCTSLKKITILDNVTYIGINTFEEHNEDLTIYCYEGSTAATYAIENEIKYVYLTRPSTGDDTNIDEDNKNTTPEEKPSDSTQKPTTDTDKKDTTTATGKLPQTGLTMGIILAIIAVLSGGVFAYFKYSKLRGI